jgi:hypothetical protein
MGLFSNTEPKVITAAQGAANAGKYLTQALDPVVESFGYQSQENQILDIMRGVDTSDIDSFNQAYKQMLGIDPEAAAEFKSQVLPMMKDTQDYKKSSLELKALENKPQLAAQWTYQAKDRSIAIWLRNNIGGDIPDSVSRSQASKYIRAKANSDKSFNASDQQRTLDAAIKANRETFMVTNALTDFSQGQAQGGYGMPTGYKATDKPVVDPANLSGTNDYLVTTEPDASQFSLDWDKNTLDAKRYALANKLRGKVFGSVSEDDRLQNMPGLDATLGNVIDGMNFIANLYTDAWSGVSGYFTDSSKQRQDKENKKEIAAWFESKASHFTSNPKDLVAILEAKDPIKALEDYYTKNKDTIE